MAKLNVYICIDHDTFCPVGAASVILAVDKGHARRLLGKELLRKGLKPDRFTVVKLEQQAQAVILNDGNY